MRIKNFSRTKFYAWYLLPTIRFGALKSGFFIAFTFLNFDLCVMFEKEMNHG